MEDTKERFEGSSSRPQLSRFSENKKKQQQMQHTICDSYTIFLKTYDKIIDILEKI